MKQEINTCEYLYFAAIGKQQNKNIIEASENGFTCVAKNSGDAVTARLAQLKHRQQLHHHSVPLSSPLSSSVYAGINGAGMQGNQTNKSKL